MQILNLHSNSIAHVSCNYLYSFQIPCRVRVRVMILTHSEEIDHIDLARSQFEDYLNTQYMHKQ